MPEDRCLLKQTIDSCEGPAVNLARAQCLHNADYIRLAACMAALPSVLIGTMKYRCATLVSQDPRDLLCAKLWLQEFHN